MATLLYAVSGVDPVRFIGASIVLIAVTLTVYYMPATRVDSVVVLCCE